MCVCVCVLGGGGIWVIEGSKIRSDLVGLLETRGAEGTVEVVEVL